MRASGCEPLGPHRERMERLYGPSAVHQHSEPVEVCDRLAHRLFVELGVLPAYCSHHIFDRAVAITALQDGPCEWGGPGRNRVPLVLSEKGNTAVPVCNAGQHVERSAVGILRDIVHWVDSLVAA